ncbi:protein of unknown function [Candidatus Nitrosocosmicus franklandus]|uniref:Uncharacterized protein n=1 Tax=Candidatus Nitrosocosmicus franklandianus TaxID=1798806 RepID=A0A484I5J5_9ARCH|nr:protein of unknown function [Candidatus Nitrosocosmicus franklandus]
MCIILKSIDQSIIQNTVSYLQSTLIYFRLKQMKSFNIPFENASMESEFERSGSLSI